MDSSNAQDIQTDCVAWEFINANHAALDESDNQHGFKHFCTSRHSGCPLMCYTCPLLVLLPLYPWEWVLLSLELKECRKIPVGHSLTVSLMLYRSSWRSLWKCVCIETLILIGKSSTRRQPCSLMVYKHLMHTREHDNTTSSSLVLVLASPWKMTANLSPCIGMRVCKW